MSRNIVFEGWLTKSPPSKRIWRTKWRRRWFALRQSGELPGQYFLDYYSDRNYRRLKGTINLDLCEQVDAGLHMERTGNGTLDPNLRGSVFTIQTQSRTYHLEADCEAEMEEWVDAICRVCGLRATDEFSDEIGTRPFHMEPLPRTLPQGSADIIGPYIPISECITGVRAQDSQRAFTFDPKNIVTSMRALEQREQICTTQPRKRLPTAEFSENESTPSDEDSKSLASSQSNIRDSALEKSLAKLTISPDKIEVYEEGPPVPPRPPKTFAMNKDKLLKETYNLVKPHEISEMQEPAARRTRPAPLSPVIEVNVTNALRLSPDENDESPSQQSMQYWNLSAMPPAVDRALKPRVSSNSYSIGSSSSGSVQTVFHITPPEEHKSDALQYLDLDLPQPQSETKDVDKKTQDGKSRLDIAHGKSYSDADADCAYKTVDFLKTEAFNITRQDAEASRSNY